MKKFLQIFSILFVCIAALLGCEKHVHTYEKGDITAADCSKDGFVSYICACGDTYREKIPQTNTHSWGDGVISIEPTCVMAGECTYTCGICGLTKTDDLAVTEKHTWDSGKETCAATAITTGEITYTCRLCGTTQKESLPAEGYILRTSTNSGKVYVDTLHTNGGAYSYCITADTPGHTGIVQEYTLLPNTLYEISVDVRTENVVCYGEIYGANIYVDGGTTSDSIIGDADWTTLSLVAKTDANGVLKVFLNLGHWFGECTGTVWYDNLSVTAYTDEINPDTVRDILLSFREVYPEGTPWGNEKYASWNGGLYSGGYGCAAFVFMLSDSAFGTLPARRTNDTGNIRVGDILRIQNDTHSVIVLAVGETSIVVAEGNYNHSVHWGREILISELDEIVSYVMTRYPA